MYRRGEPRTYFGFIFEEEENRIKRVVVRPVQRRGFFFFFFSTEGSLGRGGGGAVWVSKSRAAHPALGRALRGAPAGVPGTEVTYPGRGRCDRRGGGRGGLSPAWGGAAMEKQRRSGILRLCARRRVPVGAPASISNRSLFARRLFSQDCDRTRAIDNPPPASLRVTSPLYPPHPSKVRPAAALPTQVDFQCQARPPGLFWRWPWGGAGPRGGVAPGRPHPPPEEVLVGAGAGLGWW